MIKKLESYQFLFSELVKRDFKKKYKRTILGMLWSILSPLINVLVLLMIFKHIFGRTEPHFIIYIFSGTLVMNFYSECTQGCMRALMANASIFTKINVPKSLFLLSKSVQSYINFGLTLLIYFAFCLFDGIVFGAHVLSLIYPIVMLLIFNIGVGMLLSAMFVFFRDIEYLYSIFLMLLTYISAIFYPVTIVPEKSQMFFYANPVYVFIKYFRIVMINGYVPSIWIHLLILVYTAVVLLIGCLVYKKYNHEFLYYV
ncbi:MAG: ABC transporter permease [Oscillospiraceae bacterium]|nr:ABC transporter permease [Oscillospiraceae bacterium]